MAQEPATPPLNLYKVASTILKSGVHNSVVGDCITIDTGEYGEVEVIKDRNVSITLVFNKYGGRRFVQGEDGVLVERVNLVTMTPPPTPPTTCEGYLREWIRTFQYPDKEEGTKVAEYTSDGIEKVCLMTRTERGVIADFVSENLKLFYDLGFRVIRRYKEYKPKKKSSNSGTTREKKYKSIYGTDAQWATQKGRDGKTEKVDRRIYSTPVPCIDCGEVRYVKPSDVFQVKRCKPCQKKFKNKDKKQEKL